MDTKAFLILFTIISTLSLGACGGSSSGGLAPTPEPTNLDPSFGTNGKVVTEFISGNPVQGYAMAVQGDDKIVMAGYAYNGADYDFALARYNADGTLDTTFGSAGTGKVMTDFAGSDEKINALAIDGSGRIVVAGYTHTLVDRIFALARYNADGSLDPTFGSGTGMVTTPFYDSSNLPNDQINANAEQIDGKIVVAGEVFNGTNHDFALARYNGDGSLDTSFNDIGPSCLPGFICNGKLRTDFNSNSDYARAVIIQTDGKIVVTGISGVSNNGTPAHFTLARYNADGSLDTSFGSAGTGKVIAPFYSGQYDSAYAMTLQTDGKIVTAGYAYNGMRKNFALARYNTDGTLDSSFNNQGFCIIGNPCSGQVVTDFNGAGSHAYAMVIQPLDGKIVAAGILPASDTDFALARYNSDGSLDTNFGPAGTGMVSTNFGSTIDEAYAVALQSDGKIVAGGYSFNGANYTFALARYLP